MANNNLNPLFQRLFKEILQTTTKLVPAPIKALGTDVLFNSILPGKLQNKMEFDEGYFQDDDLEFVKEHVLAKAKATGSNKGVFEYKDYPSGTRSVERAKGGGSLTDIFTDPEQRIKKTLGQFQWEINDEGQISIVDAFNFNDAPEDRQDIPLGDKLSTIGADLDHEDVGLFSYGGARKVAQHMGSPEGQGMTFNMNIDTIDKPSYWEQAANWLSNKQTENK
tara:strand:- start:51 stop:716 length:666 start_codon:yes stop_codon:yes gene_type:complete